MATVFDQVPHFGHGSNSVDGPASKVDQEKAVVGYLANNIIRPALAQASNSDLLSSTTFAERIRNMAGPFDRGLFCRAVIESCNQEFRDEKIFRRLVLRRLLTHEYLATLINECLSKDELTSATSVICSLDSSEIEQIKGIYPSLFERELEDDIETFTFGDHRKLLLKHIGVRHRNAGVGEERLENTVSSLHEKIIKDTYQRTRLAIMDSIYELNEEDLRIVVGRYMTEYRKPLVEDLTLAGYGHFEHGLVTKIKCAMNRPEYYAEKLYKAFGAMRDPNIEGMIDADHHIDYGTIVRVITTVAERDMMKMKEEYRKKSGRALENDISEAFANSQDYLQLILMILNGDIPSPNQEYERIRNRAIQNDLGLHYRAVIERCYKQYGDDYYFRDLELRRQLPRDYYLATSINNAFEGNCLIKATEEICSLRSSEIPRLKESYFLLFGRELEFDIENHTFGDHRKLLLQGVERISIGNKIEKQCLEKIVRFLHEKVLENLKRPKMAIASQVCGLSEEDLRVVADRYHKKYGRFLEEDLTLTGYGHVEHGLVTKIKCTRNRPEYFAEKLYKAFGDMRNLNIEGMVEAYHQIDDETIVWVITIVDEIDMMMMKEEYRKKSGRALEDDLSEAFADRQDCLQLILMILNPNAPN